LFGCDEIIAVKYTEKEILEDVLVSEGDFTKGNYNQISTLENESRARREHHES
jgi:hypothetical protein